jgi:hypothetical protein
MIKEDFKNSFKKDIEKIKTRYAFEDVDIFYIFFVGVENRETKDIENIRFNKKVFNKVVNNFLSHVLETEIDDPKIYKNIDNYIYQYIKKEKNREEIRLEDIYFVLESFIKYLGYKQNVYMDLKFYMHYGYNFLLYGKGLNFTYDDDDTMEILYLRSSGILSNLPDDIYDLRLKYTDIPTLKKYFGKYYYYKAYSVNFVYLLNLMSNKNIIKPLFKKD